MAQVSTTYHQASKQWEKRTSLAIFLSSYIWFTDWRRQTSAVKQRITCSFCHCSLITGKWLKRGCHSLNMIAWMLGLKLSPSSPSVDVCHVVPSWLSQMRCAVKGRHKHNHSSAMRKKQGAARWAKPSRPQTLRSPLQTNTEGRIFLVFSWSILKSCATEMFPD